MRLLCVTLGIGILIWLLPSPPPMVFVGFLMTGSIVGARLGNRAGLPSVLGMIAVGFAIGLAPITTAESHRSLQPFVDIAMAWVGLDMGTSLSRALLANSRLRAGSLCLYTVPVLTTFFALVFSGLSLSTALQIAILSGISAPVFLDRAEHTPRDTWPLSLLAATTGLFLFLLLDMWAAIWEMDEMLPLIPDIAPSVLVGIVGIELTHCWLRHIHTPTGQFTSWFAISFLVALGSWHLGVQPLVLAWAVGLALSWRAKRGLRSRASMPKAEALIGFALAHYVSGFDWQISPVPPHFFALITALVLGKIAGGLLSSRLASQPAQAWLPLLPQGLLAIVCFEAISPATAPLYFACTGVGLLLLYLLIDPIVQKIKNGRIRARTHRTQAV